MIQRRMEVVPGEFSGSRLTFNPRLGADFEPLDIPIPVITNLTGEANFTAAVQEAVQEACGAVACKPHVLLRCGSASFSPVSFRNIRDGNIYCSNPECPLIDPPTPDDSEPLVPAPKPPALQARAEVLQLQ